MCNWAEVGQVLKILSIACILGFGVEDELMFSRFVGIRWDEAWKLY